VVAVTYGAGGNPVYFGGDIAITANGDVYFRPDAGCGSCVQWQHDGNIIQSATPTTRESWGQVKVEHR
jgi:hypothetical protein